MKQGKCGAERSEGGRSRKNAEQRRVGQKEAEENVEQRRVREKEEEEMLSREK